MNARALGLILLGIVLGYAFGIVTRASMADGLRIEAAAGVAKGTVAPDGTWWESQFPTNNRVSSVTWQVSASRLFNNRFGVRADYTDLLHFSTDNIAIPDE